MLQRVAVGPKSLALYSEVAGPRCVEELEELARPLRGKRVLHLSSTAYGGGVSELLRSLVPLYKALGIDAEWLVITGRQRFFETTKTIHNGLQGASVHLADEDREVYLVHNHRVAEALEGGYDYIVVHDPQPLAVRHLRGQSAARWVWRCHIDTSAPNPKVLEFIRPFVLDYDAVVFTMREFVPDALAGVRLFVIPPGIDPLSPKNMTAPPELCRRIVEWGGADLGRPLLTQVSRFDPWKDPLGVIEVYRKARRAVPGLQLALLGQMALDDPEGWRMYRDILREAGGDPDIHVLTNFTGIGNMEVNAFQRCSHVVLQKSLREGFGLVVSETLWKGTPVVAGKTGGIPMQMPEGVGGYLIESTEECVERVVELLRDRRTARRLGARGREHVRQHFLITRLLADELRLLLAIA